MKVAIKNKIIGFEVAKPGDKGPPPAPESVGSAITSDDHQLPSTVGDYNPLVEALPDAPMGIFDSKRYGERYHHPNKGPQTLFVTISHFPAKGLLDGEGVTVDRPFEMFMPGGQREDIQPWVTTVMKLSSLALQQGVPLSRILKRFNAPGSELIPFPCQNGKKKFFTSEVQIVGQAFTNLASAMGFIDGDGNDIPFEQRAHTDSPTNKSENTERPHNAGAMEVVTMRGEKCPECGANAVIKKDGCDYCTACGHIGACG